MRELVEYPDYQVDQRPRTLDEIRRITNRQTNILSAIESLNLASIVSNLKKMPIANRLIAQINPDSYIKNSVSMLLFVNTIQSMGTDRHVKYIMESQEGKVRLIL